MTKQGLGAAGKPASQAEAPSARRVIGNYLTRPMIQLLAKTPVTPNVITWLGFLIALGAAALVVTGHLFAAGWVVLVGGVCDLLDGALARYQGRVSRFGGILDSTLDRLSESALLLGILVMYSLEPSTMGVALAGTALVGSLMVSYIRARAEAASLKAQVGLFTRTERVVILALGLLLSRFEYVLVGALALVALFSFVTLGQRLFSVWRQTRD